MRYHFYFVFNYSVIVVKFGGVIQLKLNKMEWKLLEWFHNRSGKT